MQKSKNLDSLQVPQWVCEVRDLANANTNDDKGKVCMRSFCLRLTEEQYILINYLQPFRRSRICTEQVVPTPANQQSPKREEMLSNLRKEVRGEDLRLRVLLLSPASEARAFGDPASVACGRSNISLASDTGSVTVEVVSSILPRAARRVALTLAHGRFAWQGPRRTTSDWTSARGRIAPTSRYRPSSAEIYISQAAPPHGAARPSRLSAVRRYSDAWRRAGCA